MNIWVIVLLVLLICGAFGGSIGGYYPHSYGIGGGTVLLILLIVLFLRG
jgi:hypothetical protein